MRRFLLVATLCNEGPFILEWLAYHRAIGFSDVVVCSNHCVDGSPELLDCLQAHGLLHHHRTIVAPGEKPQLTAYAQVQMLPIVSEADWVMVLDGDEFLNVHVGSGSIADLVDAVPEATGFCVNWRIFGNAGHMVFDPGLVTSRFDRAAPLAHGVNLSFKTLFSRADAYHCRLMPHQPRYPLAKRVNALCYANGAGTILPRYFVDESRDCFLQSEAGTVSWRLAQVNHYNTRAWEDYIVKHRRGTGLNEAWRRDENWMIFNRNEEIDRTICRRTKVIESGLASLLRLDGVREAHDLCCYRYGAHARRRRAEVGSPPDAVSAL